MEAQRAVLPLFPLGQVLMPGSALPLRVFEPRYRRMLADLGEEGVRAAFGVVALTAGLEVDTGLDETEPLFARVGTVADILRVDQASDGSFALLAVGSQRFRVARLLDNPVPYVQAEVEFLAEPVGPLPETLPGSARALAGEYGRLLERLTGVSPGSEPYPTDPVALSYRLATEAALSNEDRIELLCDATATDRLQRIQRVLRREVLLVRATHSVAVSPSVIAALRPN
jgi:Lon protease-like protein